MLSNLTTRSALIVEHPPTVVLGPLESGRRNEGAPALGAAKDAAGELPETAAGPRAFLVALQGGAGPVDEFTGYAGIGDGDGDPLLAWLVRVSRAGYVAPLAVQVIFEDTRAPDLAPVVPPDAVEAVGVEACCHLGRNEGRDLFEGVGLVDVVEYAPPYEGARPMSALADRLARRRDVRGVERLR